MTVTSSARRTARRAANSGVLEALTRAGFVGYGLLHLAIAWLAVRMALGNPTGEGDQAGAFRTLAGQPFGKVLLIAIIVGLAAMAVWQALLAMVGHTEKRGLTRTFERLGSLVRAIVYAALAWTAGKVVVDAPTSTAGQQESATAGLLGRPAGQWLVGLAGVAVIAVGIGLLVYGGRRMFEQRLHTGRMSPRTRQLTGRLGQFGYAAKGIAFGIVGVLLVNAALTRNPAKSRGLDAALRSLLDKPYGPWLLIAVGFGFAAFGVFCFFQARYRKVGT